ncbi:HAD-IIB family hydrolase [Solibacillus sp. NPDC093137]|uniref:HAD-IIB family hydrolase n=1 Tax=Solibacillus sp. NPDC093137 TaxID=3390678 RepID=UPI003CFF3927
MNIVTNNEKFIITFDLDNTIIDEKGKFFPNIKEVLSELKQSENIILYLITGRMFSSLKSLGIYNELVNIFGNNIFCNEGNTIINNEKVQVINKLNTNYLENFFKVHFEKFDWIIETSEKIIFNNHSKKEALLKLSYINTNFFEYSSDLNISLFNDKVDILNIFLFPKTQVNVDYMINLFYKVHYPEEKHTLYQEFIKISPKNTDKINGYHYILDKYNERHKVIAIGDGYNDISIIKKSFLGIAVYNSHKKLIEAADIHLQSNLYDFLRSLVNSLNLPSNEILIK